MKGRANLLVVSVVVTLVCALANEVAAQAITVMPTGPTIAVGQTQQFTASGIDTARAIEAGAFHTCALLADTTLRCWGENDYGQLGNGTISSPPETPNPRPVPVLGVTGAAAVSGGGFHTCALLTNGTVRCWGRDTGDPDGRGGGQLGNPANTAFASPTPVPVTGITTAIAVAAGGFHTCALLANGTVQCWGQNDQGQLGNGTVDAPTPVAPRNPTPVTVTGITTAIAVSAGGWHTCALLRNGTVRCWGDNQRGAVGDGTPSGGEASPRRPTPTPVEVVGLSTAVALEAGIFHTCAVLQDGRVQCWGWNDFFQLGNNPPARSASSTPVTVNGVTNPAALAPGAEHSCVVLQDGRVQCWGDNGFGQLGNGSARGIFNPPTVPVTGITTATAASGAEHSCALLRDGTVRCWGRGDFGRLGDGTDGFGEPAWRACGVDLQVRCAFTPVTVVGLGVTWTSSDPTVATIDATELATGRSPGTTTITARSGGRMGSTTLTVAGAPDGGLVAAYGFDEGSGTTSADASGNNRAATISGATWTTQGRFGNALSFDGLNSRVTAETVTLGPSFTLTAWVFNPTDAAYETILTVGGARDLYLGSGAIGFYDGGTERTFGGAIATNAWHHVALVYEGASLRAYLNGALQGTDPPEALPAITGAIQIGALILGASSVDFFGGRIDEVRVYNRALTQAEVQRVMSTPIGTPPADTTPPARSNGQPTGTLAAGTTQATLGLVTGEAATCRYATTAGVAYSVMTGTFTTTGGTSHATTVGGLANGGSYTFYVRCQDGTGNVNPDDFSIAFSVASPAPPQRFTLSVTRQGTGSGTVTSGDGSINCGATCAASYDSGTSVTLTAAPTPGSTFNSWSGCDAASGTTCTVTTNVSRSVTATFSVAVVSAPLLRWQYGGCTPGPGGPRCLIGWYSSPAVADLDNDGQPDVIWGSSGDVVALRGDNGSLRWRAPSSSRVWPGIAVADLTGDGTLEVVAGRDADQLTVYDRFGSVVWTRNPFGVGEIRTLAVADLENDGRLEIVVGRADSVGPWPQSRQLTVFEPDGAVRPGWPARRDGEPGYGGGMYNENVAVADMNGDGFREIFGPSGAHYITALDRNGNQLTVNGLYAPRQFWSEVGVHVDQAADLRGYANCGVEHRPTFGASAPVVADVNGDGVPELILVANIQNCSTGASLYHLPFIFNRDRTRWSGNGFDWTVLPTPRPGSGPRSEDTGVIESALPNPVVSDLDGDGFMEILYASYDGRVHAYWLDRTERGSWPYTIPTTGAPGDDFRFASEPVVADLNNDGRAEVIFTSWPRKDVSGVGQLHVLDYLGRELYRIDLPAPSFGRTWNGGLAAPTIADLDRDGDLEVVIGTVTSGVVVFNLPSTAGARVLWGTGRGSYRRAGTPELP